MDETVEDETVRNIIVRSSALEEKGFRRTLRRQTCSGLQWGGLVGIIGVLVLVLVHWGVMGRPTAWWYPTPFSTDVFVLWDKALVVGVCAGAIGVGQTGCSLSVGRIVGGGLAMSGAVVSLSHDALRGMLSAEYLVLVYLLAVVVIAYRPWQALLFGGLLTGLCYVIGTYGLPGMAAGRPDIVTAGHLVRLGFSTVVLTGASGLLYVTRYRQYRARRTAEDLHKQVVDLERAKSRFFADVADEFRTPLTLLQGATREVRDGRVGEVPEEVDERMALIEGQAQWMSRLVDQLRELTAVDEGDLSLAVQEHDLVALVRRWMPPFQQWGTDNGLTVEVDIGPDQCSVWMDAERMGSVFADLLSNAIRYTPEGGHVRVQVQSGDEAVLISVRDTGPGLPEGLRARILDGAGSVMPVNDAEQPERERAASDQWLGIGIGLAHARAIVRRHQGGMTIESEPEFGTEVTVRLPLGREHVVAGDVATTEGAADPIEAPKWERSTSYPTGGADPAPPDDAPTVLVVDDEAAMRSYLQSLLRAHYQVTTATDGDDALDYLREHGADLVVSDAVLPGRDGRALCTAIREDEQLQHLPVVLLTTHPRSERPPEGGVGADAHVVKPFDPEELEARIENLIEIRRLLQKQVEDRGGEARGADAPALSDEDAAFLDRLHEVVDAHIDNSTFGVDWLADEMDLSARHLRRRVKDVTSLSPAGFIRTRRLQHAATLLVDGADTVSEVAAAVGYRDPSYFSQLFRDTFGCSPTAYAENNREPPDWSDIEV